MPPDTLPVALLESEAVENQAGIVYEEAAMNIDENVFSQVLGFKIGEVRIDKLGIYSILKYLMST